jgi:hypothetical protein
VIIYIVSKQYPDYATEYHLSKYELTQQWLNLCPHIRAAISTDRASTRELYLTDPRTPKGNNERNRIVQPCELRRV